MIDWNADTYAAHSRFVSELGESLLSLLRPRAGERILDLGCGDGVLARKLMDLGCAVVGIDSSESMLRAARASGVDARRADAARLAFNDEFDAVFSNAALHWMIDAEAVIAGVFRALHAGGRFVGEMGAAGNVAHLRAALHATLHRRGVDAASIDPWYFPTLDEYARELRQAGFVVAHIEVFPRPTPLPTGVAGWVGAVAHPFMSAVAPDQRAAWLQEVEALLPPSMRDERGEWVADYVRLRFKALKPSLR